MKVTNLINEAKKYFIDVQAQTALNQAVVVASCTDFDSSKKTLGIHQVDGRLDDAYNMAIAKAVAAFINETVDEDVTPEVKNEDIVMPIVTPVVSVMEIPEDTTNDEFVEAPKAAEAIPASDDVEISENVEAVSENAESESETEEPTSNDMTHEDGVVVDAESAEPEKMPVAKEDAPATENEISVDEDTEDSATPFMEDTSEMNDTTSDKTEENSEDDSVRESDGVTTDEVVTNETSGEDVEETTTETNVDSQEEKNESENAEAQVDEPVEEMADDDFMIDAVVGCKPFKASESVKRLLAGNAKEESVLRMMKNAKALFDRRGVNPPINQQITRFFKYAEDHGVKI